MFWSQQSMLIQSSLNVLQGLRGLRSLTPALVSIDGSCVLRPDWPGQLDFKKLPSVKWVPMLRWNPPTVINLYKGRPGKLHAPPAAMREPLEGSGKRNMV